MPISTRKSDSEDETERKSKIFYKPKIKMRFVPFFPMMILTALIISALLSPLISPYPPNDGNLPQTLLPPFWMKGGISSHLLGTDMLGRDILSRVIFGSRISLSVALLAVFVAGTIGTLLGLISGYFGGHIDSILMRVTDIGLSLPIILVAIILVAALGASYGNVILVITILLWPRYARQIRGEALGIKESDFVALARIACCSHARIILRHILPNTIPTLLVLASFQIGYVIMLESSLSFLGVGIPPPTASWGGMTRDGLGLVSSAWWISLWPGLAILVTVLSGNLLGDWLRDRLDPKLRQI